MIETSRNRGFRLSSTFKRIHDRLDASRSTPRGADVRRLYAGKVPAVLGLVALTSVTSWVVASISVWLVPVYMTAMVLIFAMPRTTVPEGAAEAPEAPAIEPVEGAEPTPDDDSPDASSTPVEPAAVDAGAEAPKPRKRRGKRRRSARAAAAWEVDPASAQVMWIRVGPGKFVRADVQDPEAEGSSPPTSLPEVDVTDEGAPPDPPPTEDETPGDAEPPEEPCSFERPDPPEVAEAPAEEHGITPSTLGEGAEDADLPEDAECEDFPPDVVATPESEPIADPEPVAALAAPIEPAAIPSTTRPQEQGPTRPMTLLAPPTAETPRRRTVGPVVASVGLRNVRRDEPTRCATLKSRTTEVRLRQRSSRIRSRSVHVQRAFHPRSPPARA